MLIITRKAGEGLFIGDDIRITILDIRGKQVRLGIEAPSTTVILREEIRANRKRICKGQDPGT